MDLLTPTHGLAKEFDRKAGPPIAWISVMTELSEVTIKMLEKQGQQSSKAPLRQMSKIDCQTYKSLISRGDRVAETSDAYL